jgi:arabinan endo-1,5-alpha-L-arabinosidase
MKTQDIQIRDPFIVPVPQEGRYYLFGTTDVNCWDGGQGFDGYWSTDLQSWEGPFPAFRAPAGFWADRNFWAPEVHAYGGQYYMFASFKAEGVCRGTQILVAPSIQGPYVPYSQGAVTPRFWECLDGTLFVDDNREPWIVFCHEWVQIHDGEICATRLTRDLKRPAGEPAFLFHASKAPWVRSLADPRDFVTDGPFLYRAQNGALFMLWSSFGEQGYAIGVARSPSGRVAGPWTHDPEPLYARDGGHGMLFRTFEGQLMLTIHTPNQTPNERPIFLPVREENGRLVMG